MRKMIHVPMDDEPRWHGNASQPIMPIQSNYRGDSVREPLLQHHGAVHHQSANSSSQGFCVRVRGIPFQESEYTVMKWFNDRGVRIRNGVLGVHFLYNDKRQWSGDAYIQLENEKDVEAALSHNEGQMNHRYLEIFRTGADEMDSALKRSPFYRLPNDYAVRLRGLEYRVTKQDIRDFFQGLDIASGLDGIYIVENQEGRPTGEAYVMFENKTAVEQAAQKHKEKLGQRYVEIFLASSSQIRDAREFYPDERDPPGRGYRGYSEDRYSGPPPGPPQRRGQSHFGGGHAVPQQSGWFDEEYRNEDRGYRQEGNGHQNYDQYNAGSDYRLYMRGLPWVCTERDIEQFFSPIRCGNITKNMSSSNVFDGSAWVEFENENDFEAARKKHKTNMGHRYIELFTEEEVDAKRLRTNRDRERNRAPPPPPARRTHSPSPRRGGRGGGGGGRGGRGGGGGTGGQRRDDGNRRDMDRRPPNARQEIRPQGNQRGQPTFTYVPTTGGMNTRPAGRPEVGYGSDSPQQIPVSYGNFGSPMGQMGGNSFPNNNAMGMMSLASANAFEAGGRFAGDMTPFTDQMFQQNLKPLGSASHNQGYNSLLPPPHGHMPFAAVTYP